MPFTPDFLRQLEGLRILARRVPAGGRLAEQNSRARGGGVEFTDVRPYVPGDDFRAIDWHLWQRLDRVFLRLFLEDEDLPIHVLLDESTSMAQPPIGRREPRDKLDSARQAVAAIAYVGSHHLDRVTVWPFAGEPERPSPGTTGQAAFHRLLVWLDARRADGTTDLVAAIRRLAAQRVRRGTCVIVSDFLDPSGADAVLSALRSVPHTPVLLRMIHPHEERPDLAGEIELVDSETGERLALHVDDATLDRYEREWRSLDDTLAGFARSRRGRYASLRTDEPVVPQIARLFRGGALHV